MEASDNRAHWTSWAKEYQNDLRATTKGRTIKEIEIHSIVSAIEKYASKDAKRVLECGCGNGYNLIEVAKKFPQLECVGFDFVPEMVENARDNKSRNEKESEKNLNIKFEVGDLRSPGSAEDKFDVIFTNRAIINLSSHEEQIDSLLKLGQKLKTEGTLILLENSLKTFAAQNDLRKAVGLNERKPAEFNVFLDEQKIIDAVVASGLTLLVSRSIASLHDILLYVLLPRLTKASDNYNDPIMELAKNLEISAGIDIENSPFGNFGQVNLYIFKK